jgi:hypothetical protein
MTFSAGGDTTQLVRKRRGREIAKRGLAAAIGIVAAAILVEAALRVAGFARPVMLQPDPVLGTMLIPGLRVWQSREGRAWTETNSHGWRDRERPTQKPTGAYRIAVLGDSFVQASEVPFEESLCPRLEYSLRAVAPNRSDMPAQRVEVLCFGVSGYGTAQELLAFRHHVARFQPDFVVLLFYPGNDVSDNKRSLSHPERLSPYFTLDGSELVPDNSFRQASAYRARMSLAGRVYYTALKHSRLAQLIQYVRRQGLRGEPPRTLFGIGDDPEVYRPPRVDDWSEAWRVTEALIRQLHREVVGAGAEFGVAIAATPAQLFPDDAIRRAAMREQDLDDLSYPERRIQALGNDAGFPVLALQGPMRAVADRGVYLHGFGNTQLGLGHWNADGHRIAAQGIANWLIDLWRRDGVAGPTVTRHDGQR